MANFLDHIKAFFSPSVAIDQDGNKVIADGIFDSGNGNVAISDEVFDEYTDLNSILTDSFFNNPDYERFSASSPDDVIDFYDTNQLYDKIVETTESQNQAAQTSADRAMEFNAEQAALNREWQEVQNQKAMDFSERMSNTAMQRQMADLKAAGLNPKLAAQLGGASAPSGVTSSGSSASGSVASMAAASLSPLASVLSTYITGSDALDRQNNDFVQRAISTLFKAMVS